MTAYQAGDRVALIDDFNGHNTHRAFATVERVTKTLVIVRTEGGTEGRYRLKDSRITGYSWPNYTLAIQPAPRPVAAE